MNVMILPSSAFDDTTAIIDEVGQLTHIKTVLKADVGDTLKIGKLGDKMGVGQIVHIDDNGCILHNVRLDADPPPKLGVTVVLALPRPKVLRRLIMDMTSFGVHHIILINSVRTDKSYWASPLLNRLDEFILEGLQQGMDSIPPTITLAKRFKPFVQDELPHLITGKSALVFHPYANTSFTSFVSKNPLPKIIIIGAEGGFVPYEIDLLASVGVQSVNMGERILRTESAVNAVLGRWV
ncbi:16S rRNA (uracil(1498)-N(3))-methyltransferase [Moraxella nonliquefaciens]|jgi:RNA methyltransferase, rsmE family|uniref:16S rRNA (uracil(1498)-N(3))-methyltransferase n=1 Tax=Moraxella nonliquefaciens TaxID=478 RepID=UPI00081E4FFC|nr:16S rRNA (uracil(1498)-N(3))-methyltransferase [Moraxella nonliquefaciens]OBX50091.1 16S rRNA (uracil(1498)-N(3))-methyltransferase [Moraxella nonliquefaciens]